MKVKISIPTSLDDIKLKDYQKYIKIVDENKDAIDFLNIKLIEIFCGLKIKDINQIKVKDFESILGTLTKTFEQDKPFQQRFTISDVEYGFIPKLDDISMGEYIDLTTYLGDIKDLHKAMAVMYRPITLEKKDRYLIEDYEGTEKYSDWMKEAPLSVVLGAQVFFYNLANELLKYTVDYLVEDQTIPLAQKVILQKSMAGITPFMHLEGVHSLN